MNQTTFINCPQAMVDIPNSPSLNCSNSFAEWVNATTIKEPFYVQFNKKFNNYSWSRRMEYPWTLLYGRFCKGQKVLDAAGGDGILQFILSESMGCHVTNVDAEKQKPSPTPKLTILQGNIQKLTFPNEHFDRVMCISVLEHIPEPIPVIDELWRVLKTNGRFVLTFDVAPYSRWNHSIDYNRAKTLLSRFGVNLSDLSTINRLSAKFNEVDPQPNELKQVTIETICLVCDKV